MNAVCRCKLPDDPDFINVNTAVSIEAKLHLLGISNDLWKLAGFSNDLSNIPDFGLYTHKLSFNGHFPGEPGLAGCPLNSPSPFIPGLCILLGRA